MDSGGTSTVFTRLSAAKTRGSIGVVAIGVAGELIDEPSRAEFGGDNRILSECGNEAEGLRSFCLTLQLKGTCSALSLTTASQRLPAQQQGSCTLSIILEPRSINSLGDLRPRHHISLGIADSVVFRVDMEGILLQSELTTRSGVRVNCMCHSCSPLACYGCVAEARTAMRLECALPGFEFRSLTCESTQPSTWVPRGLRILRQILPSLFRACQHLPTVLLSW